MRLKDFTARPAPNPHGDKIQREDDGSLVLLMGWVFREEGETDAAYNARFASLETAFAVRKAAFDAKNKRK